MLWKLNTYFYKKKEKYFYNVAILNIYFYEFYKNYLSFIYFKIVGTINLIF